MLPLNCSTIVHHTAAQQCTAIKALRVSLHWQVGMKDIVLPMLHPRRFAFNLRLLLSMATPLTTMQPVPRGYMTAPCLAGLAVRLVRYRCSGQEGEKGAPGGAYKSSAG